jgi:hypothetical protein
VSCPHPRLESFMLDSLLESRAKKHRASVVRSSLPRVMRCSRGHRRRDGRRRQRAERTPGAARHVHARGDATAAARRAACRPHRGAAVAKGRRVLSVPIEIPDVIPPVDLACRRHASRTGWAPRGGRCVGWRRHRRGQSSRPLCRARSSHARRRSRGDHAAGLGGSALSDVLRAAGHRGWGAWPSSSWTRRAGRYRNATNFAVRSCTVD